MTLRADMALRLGTLELTVDLEVAPGELLALLGPNGAGKSTVLRCLAGLEPIDSGRIDVDGVTFDDPVAGVFIDPEHRPIGFVFQDYLLFANMTVLENVAFGLRARKVPKQQARATARTWVERVGLGDYADERPAALSGGQAQRAALARALATDPRVLLLDEPLAALDAGTRTSVRRDLRRHLETFDGMRILVTHDPVDAYALADRVAILDAGRIVQVGTLSEVAAHPRSRYVADLVGVNLVTGNVGDGVLVTGAGARRRDRRRPIRPVVRCDPPALDRDRAIALAGLECSQRVARHDDRRRPSGRSRPGRHRWRPAVDGRDHRRRARRVATAPPATRSTHP